MERSEALKSARPYISGEVRRSVLPGGLRVLSEDMPGSHSFSVGVFVAVGSRHETKALHGASHFLEHVLFKGTARRDAAAISGAIEQVGGDLNAYTAKEHTCFYAKVLEVDAAMAVDVLVDMISESLIRQADVQAERAVILDEIALHADDPLEVASELMSEQLLANSPLGPSVIGSAASIKALTRDQIVGYWRRRYHPGSLVVSAAGHVDHDALVDWLGALDGLQRGTGKRTTGKTAPSLPADPEPVVRFRSRPTEHSTAVLGFATPGLFDERRYALNLLSVIIGGGMSSRLFMEVRERRSLTYSIDAGENAYTDAGQFTIEWGGAPENMPEICSLVRDCLADVIDNGVTEEELARAKGQIRGQTVLGFEGPTARMSRLGNAELVGDDRSVRDILGKYAAVTLNNVTEVAREFLTVAPVLGVVGAPVNRRRLERAVQSFVR